MSLTHKHLKMHGFVISTVATDALALKHQSIHVAGSIAYKFNVFSKEQ